MRGRYLSLLALLLCCVSCLNEDKESKTPQAVISSFTLGYYKVKVQSVDENGKDTVLYTVESGIMYPMTIDQVHNRIYNADSMAYGSDLSRVVTSINGTGFVTYSYADEPQYKYLWTNYDSIDFTRDVEFFMTSSDGTFTRKYEVEVNIHKVFPDSVKWVCMANTEFPALTGINAVVRNDSVYCFGTDGTGVKAVSYRDISVGDWNGANALTGLPDGWQHRVTVCKGKFYTVSDSTVYESADGVNWSLVKAGIKSIVVTGEDYGELWAVTCDSFIVRSNDMADWVKVQKLTADFPDSASIMFRYPLATNKNLYRSMLVGLSADTLYASVWNLLSGDTVWTKMDIPSKPEVRLPAVKSLSVISYDGSFFSMGQGMGGFRESDDNGLTWNLCKSAYKNYSPWNPFMQLPEEVKDYNSVFTGVTDSNGYIWIMTDDGRVWRGAMNRLKKN